MTFTEYLRAGAARPFVWGECDCCTWAADWCKAVAGVDPSAPLRGRYKTERGAMRHVARAGGFVPLIADHMAVVGLHETTDPQSGDIGVVVTAHGQALGLKTASGWACKGPRGLAIGNPPMLMAWSIPCRQS